MHGGIAVELRDQRQQFVLSHIRWQHVLERRHAGGLGLSMLVADVNLAGGIVADQHHRQSWRQVVVALQSRHLIGDAGTKLRGNDFSIDDGSRHERGL